MIAVKIALAVLVLWYLCGIFNVSIIQGTRSDEHFNQYNRSTTLWFCYGPAPILTLIILGYGLVIKPIKYGTRLGRFLGRKLENILD